MERVLEHKDLGVVFDSKFKFSSHVAYISSRANKVLGFVIRSSKDFKSITALKVLYYSYVRSILEYASVVWNPKFQYNINILEMIQKKFLKYLVFKIDSIYPEHGSDYAELCTRFGIPSLAARRMLHQLIFLFKLINYRFDCPYLLSMLSVRVPRLPVRAVLSLFYLPLCNTNILMRSPLYSMCSLYNCHSHNLDIFTSSLATFYTQTLNVLQLYLV